MGMTVLRPGLLGNGFDLLILSPLRKSKSFLPHSNNEAFRLVARRCRVGAGLTMVLFSPGLSPQHTQGVLQAQARATGCLSHEVELQEGGQT